MIKKLLTWITFVFIPVIHHAQKDSLPKVKPSGSWTSHHFIFSAGLGNYNVDPFLFYKRDESSSSTSTISNVASSVYHLKAEAALNGHLGIAVCFNHSSLQFKNTYNYLPYNSQVHTIKTDFVVVIVTSVNLRLNYHFIEGGVVDPYIGIGAGLRRITLLNSKEIAVFEPHIPFGFELTLGIRYLLVSRIGIYGEAGIGRSLYQIGVSVNIGRLKNKFRKGLF